MNDFLHVAKSLEIKDIRKDVDAPDSQNDQEYDTNIKTNIENCHEEKNIVHPIFEDGEINHKSSKVVSQKNEAGQFPCNRCEKLYTSRPNLSRHIQSAHEGIKFPCNDCGYKATIRQDLIRHIQSVHEGIKFPCDLCDYKATQKSYLVTHKRNKH